MSSKNKADGIIAVVCPTCNFADQVLESGESDRTCPECHTTMITETLSGRKHHLITRNLKVVKPNLEKERTMTKAAKIRKPPVVQDVHDETPDENITEVMETFVVSSSDVGTAEDVLSEEPPSESVVAEDSPRAQRTQVMTQAEIWTTYASVLNCKSPDEIFDVCGRTFDDKWHLAWWNNRVGLNELYVFYRPRDTVEFFRKCSHEIWSRMRHGTLNPPEKASYSMWSWKLHAQVMRAKSPDDIFDEFARSIEFKSDMTGWLYRTEHGNLVALGKGVDLIDYFRRVAHRIWNEMHKKS